MSLDPSSKALRRVLNSAPNGIPVISEELTQEIIKERDEFWAAYEKRVCNRYNQIFILPLFDLMGVHSGWGPTSGFMGGGGVRGNKTPKRLP